MGNAGKPPLSDAEERELLNADLYKFTVDLAIKSKFTWHGGSAREVSGRPQIPCGTTSFSTSLLRDISSGDAMVALYRHSHGVWGLTPGWLAARNDKFLAHGGPLISLHKTEEGVKFILYTRSDRSETLFMLVQEFMRGDPALMPRQTNDQMARGIEISRQLREQSRQHFDAHAVRKTPQGIKGPERGD